MSRTTLGIANLPFLKSASMAAILVASLALAGCATTSRQISYDATVPPLPTIRTSAVDTEPKPVLVPPAWTPAKGGDPAATPAGRVENANKAARVEPRKEGYFNAIQIYPWSNGALYQIYAAPGQITDIALEPGENLTGDGPIAAGDTTRWIIGNTQSGSGPEQRVHVLVKPTRPKITTNLVITTDRRTYMMELRADTSSYMPAVAWSYPQVASQRLSVPATPTLPVAAARHYRYRLTGGNPPWRPISVYDDGRHVYVEFPGGIAQGEMPPIFVIDSDGQAQIVNTRVLNNVLIVDQLFAAAELRLGNGSHQQTVRIVRTYGAHAS